MNFAPWWGSLRILAIGSGSGLCVAAMGTDAKNNFLASAATATYLLAFSELSFSAADHAVNAQ